MKSTTVGLLARSLEPSVAADLREKMVLLSGPRQCGKTTLARRLLDSLGGSYFTWDDARHRATLRSGDLPASDALWVFDEIHKFRGWRAWLKGVYDTRGDDHAILVTGSGRLDLLGRGGDSLQGRHFAYRMHPFTVGELLAPSIPKSPDDIPKMARDPGAAAADALASMLRFGPFPEPLLRASERHSARWRLSYGSRLVREEVRTISEIRDLDRLELLVERLEDVVGSVLSINALREDLEVAFETVRQWISVLERLCAVYRIAPYGPTRIKAVKKEQKLYFWDWARVKPEPARFENLVISHLLRLVHWLEDVHGERAELRFFRNVVGHEVDAIVLRGRAPWLAVEIKSDDRPVDDGLRYLLERVRVPHAFQVSLRGTLDVRAPDIHGCAVRRMPAAKFLANLP